MSGFTEEESYIVFIFYNMSYNTTWWKIKSDSNTFILKFMLKLFTTSCCLKNRKFVINSDFSEPVITKMDVSPDHLFLISFRNDIKKKYLKAGFNCC